MTNKSNKLLKYHSVRPNAKSEIRKSVTKPKKSTSVKRTRYLADKLDHHRRVSSVLYYRSKRNALRDRDEFLELQEIGV